MRLLTFEAGSEIRLGALVNDTQIVDLDQANQQLKEQADDLFDE